MGRGEAGLGEGRPQEDGEARRLPPGRRPSPRKHARAGRAGSPVEWRIHCAGAVSGDTLGARSPVTSQRAFDGEPPGRRAHLQRGSIEPLKAQQLPGAVGGAPRGPVNERPLGNSRLVPSPRAGKEKCSSSATPRLKGTLSPPRSPHVHDKGAAGAGREATVPAGRRCAQVWRVHPDVEPGPVPGRDPGLAGATLRPALQGAPAGKRRVSHPGLSLGKWRSISPGPSLILPKPELACSVPTKEKVGLGALVATAP